MKAVIAVLAGDGIGPEIIAEAVKVLRVIESKYGHEFDMPEALFGAVAIDATGSPLPPETLALAERADAILFGAVGDPRFADPNLKVRPEQGILGLRKALGLYANLRPVTIHEAILDVSPLKPEYLQGVDIMVVRELTGVSTSVRRHAPPTPLRTFAFTAFRKSSVSSALQPVLPADAARSSPRWTKLTSWKPRVYGVRLPPASWPKSSPMSRWTTCTSTRQPCICCAVRRTSMSSSRRTCSVTC